MKLLPETPELVPELIPLDFPETRPLRKGWTEQMLLHLGESLAVKQVNPIYVVKNTRLVIAGNSRILAGRMVNLKHLFGYLIGGDVTELEQKQWEVFENAHRVDLLPHEQWQNCEQIKLLHPDWDNRQIGEFLKLDPSSITRYLAPGKTLPAIQEAFCAGAISLSAVYEISKCDLKDQHAEFVAAMDGATREQLQVRRTRKRNGTVPAARVSRVKLPLQHMSIVVSGESIGLDELVLAFTDLLKQMKKAAGESFDVRTFSAMLTDKAKGGDRD